MTKKQNRLILDLALGAILAAKEQKLVPEFMDDLDLLSAILTTDARVKNALTNVVVPFDKRYEAVKNILGGQVEPLTLRTIGLLMDRHLIGSYATFQSAVEAAAKENANYHICRTVSAIPLNESAQKKLKTALEKKLTGTVKIRYEIDPSVIGGLSVTCGDWRYLNTVQAKLHQLTRHLITTN
ncbi:MAG: ATP synthase F1 subunit delta [Patescibacteria group bacterium]|jgi:F-type H+-transporting ATPase subunit delta